MASYESRRNVEVRFAQLDDQTQHAQLEQRAIAANERQVLTSDREPSREELQTIQELLDAVASFWRRLGVEEPIATANQFVPVRQETLVAQVRATPELHDLHPAFVQNGHVYYSESTDQRERVQILSHELSHLAAKQVLQVEPSASSNLGLGIAPEVKMRQRREGARFAARAWENDSALGYRGFEGYHEAIMEFIACEVRHEWCDAKGLPEDSPERDAITEITAGGAVTRIVESLMDEYVAAHPGVTRRQLKDEAYLDARNGIYFFIKRLHSWSPLIIKPLAQMGLSYASQRDTAYTLVSAELGDQIEEYRVTHNLE